MSSIPSDVYASLGLAGANAGKADKKDESMGQADFLRLMTEQLKHQDPLKPMENSAFLGQLAQFSTVQGIQDLNTAVGGFASAQNADQIMRGATLVGRDVLVPSGSLALGEDGGANGVVAAPAAGTVVFEITNGNGEPVRQLSVPAAAAGEVAFAWDGNDAAGNRLPPGKYAISASHSDGAGNVTELENYVQARVESVTVGSDGLYLDLRGLGTAPIDHVLRIS